MSEALDPRGSLLLRIARHALQRRLGDGDEERGSPAEHAAMPWLIEPAATFVSLHQRGRLRGCVGSLEPIRPLIDDVRRNAVAAALEDTRFPPVSAPELAGLLIEVTLLAPRERIWCRSEHEAIAQLRPGVDGLVLSYQGRRATFLPQVWATLPEPAHFVSALKEKGGLPARFWDAAIVVERYTARSWSEDGEAAGPG